MKTELLMSTVGLNWVNMYNKNC